MPLDTQPLSPARRLVAAGVLLAILAGSLGAAQAIVSNRRNAAAQSRAVPVALLLPLSAEFRPVQTPRHEGERARAWRILRNTSVRTLHEIIAPTDQPQTFDGASAVAAAQLSRLQLQPEARLSSTLAGVPALFLSCVDRNGSPMALARVTIVNGAAITLLWVAEDMPIDGQDRRIFAAVSASATLIVDGRPLVPATRKGSEAFVPASQK